MSMTKIEHLHAAGTTRKARGPIVRRAAEHTIDFSKASDETLLRKSDMTRDPKRPGKATLLPFSKSSLERRVAAGTFPQPLKLGARVTCWRLGDIREWLTKQGA